MKGKIAKPRRNERITATQDAEARRRLVVYLLAVVEDEKADTKRRDRAAIRLARMVT